MVSPILRSGALVWCERLGFMLLATMLCTKILAGEAVHHGIAERVAVVAALGVVSADAARIDTLSRRLPRVLILPAYALAAASALLWGASVTAWTSAAVVWSIAFLMALCAGLGGGDVWLMALVALGLGALGPVAVATALTVGLTWAGTTALFAYCHPTESRAEVPLGPAIIVGYWCVAVVTA